MRNLDGASEALVVADNEAGEGVCVAVAIAILRIALNNPHNAVMMLASVLAGRNIVEEPYDLGSDIASLLGTVDYDAFGADEFARRLLERAHCIATFDGARLPFRVGPTPDVPERHDRRPVHEGFMSEILDQLDGVTRTERSKSRRLTEPLTESELRVLRYLPTNLTQPEIAAELYVSANTVNTHISHVYRKLGAHRRGEAVECARGLGLLATIPRRH